MRAPAEWIEVAMVLSDLAQQALAQAKVSINRPDCWDLETQSSILVACSSREP